MARSEMDLRDERRRTTTVTGDAPTRRLPETKTFLASSEFWVMAGALVALFFAGYVFNDIADGLTWKYGTWVAIAYIVSRGIAKAGSQRTYERDDRGT